MTRHCDELMSLISCFSVFFSILSVEALRLAVSMARGDHDNLPSVTYSVPTVTYTVPKVTYTVPNVTYSVPSTVNYNTTSVSGYVRSNGTYVDSYIRTMPNSTNWDNFSTQGNSNPYTGSTGYRARDYSSGAYNYGAGHTIHTGSRGGQYYYNSSGNKVYVPKRK